MSNRYEIIISGKLRYPATFRSWRCRLQQHLLNQFLKKTF